MRLQAQCGDGRHARPGAAQRVHQIAVRARRLERAQVDHAGGDEVVAGQAELPGVEAVAPAEREAADADRGAGAVHDLATAARERIDQLDLHETGARHHRAVRQQPDAAQALQVEDHPARNRRGADVAVAAGADADRDVARARDLQARRQVAGIEGQRDGRGVHVVVARVVDGRDARVRGRAGQQHGTPHRRLQGSQRTRRPAQLRQGDRAHPGAHEQL